MDCDHARLLLSFRRDLAALDRSEADHLNEHLEQCPDCAGLTAADQRLDQALGRAMRAVSVPAGLKERLLSVLPGPRPLWRRWRFVASAAAAALLLAGGSVYLYFLLSRTPIQHPDRSPAMQFSLLTSASKGPDVEAEIQK